IWLVGRNMARPNAWTGIERVADSNRATRKKSGSAGGNAQGHSALSHVRALHCDLSCHVFLRFLLENVARSRANGRAPDGAERKMDVANLLSMRVCAGAPSAPPRG